MKMSSYDIKKIYEWPAIIKFFLFFILSVMIFYVGFLLDVRNLQIYTRNSSIQEHELFQQLKEVLNNKRKVEEDIAQLPILQETLNNWEKKLVTSSDMPIILDDLIKMASLNHIRLNLLDPQNEVKDKFYNKTPVKMQLAGQFDEIASFLSQIANMDKIVTIGDFSFMRIHTTSPQPGESKTSKINYSQTLDWDGGIEIYKKG